MSWYMCRFYLGIIMVLGASFEFDKEHNKDVVIRPTDETEVPTVQFAVARRNLYWSRVD